MDDSTKAFRQRLMAILNPLGVPEDLITDYYPAYMNRSENPLVDPRMLGGLQYGVGVPEKRPRDYGMPPVSPIERQAIKDPAMASELQGLVDLARQMAIVTPDPSAISQSGSSAPASAAGQGAALDPRLMAELVSLLERLTPQNNYDAMGKASTAEIQNHFLRNLRRDSLE